MTTSPSTPLPSDTSWTPDLTGWWRIVYRYCHWNGLPLDEDNHPLATPEHFCLPDRWQQTAFVKLGLPRGGEHLAEVAADGARVWCNVDARSGGGDVSNAYLVQLSDQRHPPSSLGVVEASGLWRVSANAGPLGLAVTMSISGTDSPYSSGDVRLVIASAPPSPAASSVRARPDLHGSRLALMSSQDGSVTAAPLESPPALPA